MSARFGTGPTPRCSRFSGPSSGSIPTCKAAKDFDVSTLSTSFGGYEFHRLRRGNVSLIWATGGARGVAGPSKDEVKTVERCLKA